MSKQTGWLVVLAAFVVLIAVVYFATRHSQHVDAVQTGNTQGSGAAYDATTGNTVPADAQQGALGGVPAKTVAPVVVSAAPKGS